jgi:hypothetical protein
LCNGLFDLNLIALATRNNGSFINERLLGGSVSGYFEHLRYKAVTNLAVQQITILSVTKLCWCRFESSMPNSKKTD